MGHCCFSLLSDGRHLTSPFLWNTTLRMHNQVQGAVVADAQLGTASAPVPSTGPPACSVGTCAGPGRPPPSTRADASAVARMTCAHMERGGRTRRGNTGEKSMRTGCRARGRGGRAHTHAGAQAPQSYKVGVAANPRAHHLRPGVPQTQVDGHPRDNPRSEHRPRVAPGGLRVM